MKFIQNTQNEYENIKTVIWCPLTFNLWPLPLIFNFCPLTFVPCSLIFNLCPFFFDLHFLTFFVLSSLDL